MFFVLVPPLAWFLRVSKYEDFKGGFHGQKVAFAWQAWHNHRKPPKITEKSGPGAPKSIEKVTKRACAEKVAKKCEKNQLVFFARSTRAGKRVPEGGPEIDEKSKRSAFFSTCFSDGLFLLYFIDFGSKKGTRN